MAGAASAPPRALSFRTPGATFGIWGDHGSSVDGETLAQRRRWSDARRDVLMSLSDASLAVKSTNFELRQGLDFICNQLSAAAVAAQSTSAELRYVGRFLGSDIIGDLMDAMDAMHVVSSAQAANEVLDRLQHATNAVNRSNARLHGLLGLRELGRLSDAASVICEVSKEARRTLKMHHTELKDFPHPDENFDSARSGRAAGFSRACRVVHRLAACSCFMAIQCAFVVWSKAVELSKKRSLQVRHHQVSEAWNLSIAAGDTMLMATWLFTILRQWRAISHRVIWAYHWRFNACSFVSHATLDRQEQFLQVVWWIWREAIASMRIVEALDQRAAGSEKRVQLTSLSVLMMNRITKADVHGVLVHCTDAWRLHVLEGAIELACKQLQMRRSKQVDAISSLLLRFREPQFIRRCFDAWRIVALQHGRGRRETKQVDRLSKQMLRAQQSQRLHAAVTSWRLISLHSMCESLVQATRRRRENALKIGLSLVESHAASLRRTTFRHWQSWRRLHAVHGLRAQWRNHCKPALAVMVSWRTVVFATQGAHEVFRDASDVHTIKLPVLQPSFSACSLEGQHGTKDDMVYEKRKVEMAALYNNFLLYKLFHLILSVWHFEVLLLAASQRQAFARQECGKDLRVLAHVAREPADATAEEMATQFAELIDWELSLFCIVAWQILTLTDAQHRAQAVLQGRFRRELDKAAKDVSIQALQAASWKDMEADLEAARRQAISTMEEKISQMREELAQKEADGIEAVGACCKLEAQNRDLAAKVADLQAQAISLMQVESHTGQNCTTTVGQMIHRWVAAETKFTLQICFRVWRMMCAHSRSLKAERKTWEDFVTSIYVDVEHARSIREAQEEKHFKDRLTVVKVKITNWETLLNAKAQVIELIGVWHRHCVHRRLLRKKNEAMQASLLRWMRANLLGDLSNCYAHWKTSVLGARISAQVSVQSQSCPVSPTSVHGSQWQDWTPMSTEYQFQDRKLLLISFVQSLLDERDTLSMGLFLCAWYMFTAYPRFGQQGHMDWKASSIGIRADQALQEHALRKRHRLLALNSIDGVLVLQSSMIRRAPLLEILLVWYTYCALHLMSRKYSDVSRAISTRWMKNLHLEDLQTCFLDWRTLVLKDHVQILHQEDCSTSRTPRAGQTNLISHPQTASSAPEVAGGLEFTPAVTSQTFASGKSKQDQCVEAVELVARSCQRRRQEDLVQHCTNAWHAQAHMTAKLMNVEKELHLRCEEQLERLRKQHDHEMRELRRQCEEVAAQSNKGQHGFDKDAEEEQWLDAMQRIVDDLQRENQLLHQAVKASGQ